MLAAKSSFLARILVFSFCQYWILFPYNPQLLNFLSKCLQFNYGFITFGLSFSTALSLCTFCTEMLSNRNERWPQRSPTKWLNYCYYCYYYYYYRWQELVMVTAGGALLPKTGIPEFLRLNGSIAIKLLTVCLQRMIKRSLGLGYPLFILFIWDVWEWEFEFTFDFYLRRKPAVAPRNLTPKTFAQ